MINIAFDGVFTLYNDATAFVTADVYLQQYGWHLALPAEGAAAQAEYASRGCPPPDKLARRLQVWMQPTPGPEGARRRDGL
jgi:hypothetical protein